MAEGVGTRRCAPVKDQELEKIVICCATGCRQALLSPKVAVVLERRLERRMLAHDIQGMRKRMSAGACGGANGPSTTEDTACRGGSGFAINAFQETQITRPIKKL
jgi:hypothetical protein